MGGPLPAMIHVMEAMTSVGLPPSASREEADDYRRFEAIYRELCVLQPGTPSLRGKDKWERRVHSRVRAGTFSLETKRFFS